MYKRGKIWWIDFTTTDGVRIRQSSQTSSKKLAQALCDKLKTESWMQSNAGKKPKRTWQDAINKWCLERQDKKSIKNDLSLLKWINEYVPSSMELTEINRNFIDLLIQKKLATGVKNSTVNRGLALIRSILNAAHKEWNWLASVPNIRLLKEPRQKLRFLTHEEADKLIQELPAHLASMVKFSLATGLREQNVTKLKWSSIDFENRTACIQAEEMKTNRVLNIPLNTKALEVLNGQLNKHPVYVFTYNNNVITRANNSAWKKALMRAGISNFRWHDLRRTWACWHIQQGTPIHVLKELGGWQTLEMVLIYAYLNKKHLANFAEV
jgi:integrase